MAKVFIFLILDFGFYNWYSENYYSVSASYTNGENTLIMYSLTTCGYCKVKVKVKELHSANIAFMVVVEHHIDKSSLKVS